MSERLPVPDERYDDTFMPDRFQKIEHDTVSCVACDMTWHSVHPHGVVAFECPRCGLMMGRVMQGLN